MSSLAFGECCFLSIPREGYRLTWEVTQFCPSSCEYCFTWSSPRREKLECDINSAIKKLQILAGEAQIQDVLITGGEPLSVVKEIAPFLSFLNHEGITFSFSSNLYDEKLFATVCRFRPRAINLSIDPPSDVHGTSSFKASYDSIEKKLDMVEMEQIPLKVTAVITRRNHKHIEDLLDYLSAALRRHANIAKIGFNREYPIGHAAEYEPQNKGELRKTFASVRKWAGEVSIPVSMVNWDIFHSPLQYCPAGKNLISIMPNADVAPCSLLYNFTRSFRVGNLLKDPLRDVLQRLETFSEEIQKYDRLTKSRTPACSTCEIEHQCGGGCPAMLPIASNHVSRRTCKLTPTRVTDHERRLLSSFHHDFHVGYSPDARVFIAPKEQLPDAIERRIRRFIRKKLRPSDLAHTMEHVDCVVTLAKLISKKEGASLKITVPAAYCHDICPREPAMHHMHTFKSAVIARDFLRQTDFFTEEELTHIQFCIYTSSYGSYLLGYPPLSLEAKAVRDADWLDAIGARGIARVFAFGEAHGAKSFGYPDMDPDEFMISMDMNITGPDRDPITHFFTKLLKIHSLLQTTTGQQLGKRRHQLMVDFLREYREEMDIEKDPDYQLRISFRE